MLIIFDLDDTLIDTTGSIKPWVFKHAVEAMLSKGLTCVDPDEAYAQLLRMSHYHKTSQDALEEFIEIHKASADCMRVGMREIYEKPTLPDRVDPMEGAIELLKELSTHHLLALVTKGDEGVQREKMGRAGIDETLFSHLYFCKKWNKKEAYKEIQKKEQVSSRTTLACGDRVLFDLTPAKELGFRTVQLERRRGVGNAGLKNDVDYTISSVRELKRIIEELKVL